jgi:hypothetical protein
MRSRGPFTGDYRFGNEPDSTRDTSPQALASKFGVDIGNKPDGIDARDGEEAKTYEFNTGNGGINVHAGRTSQDSTGCILVGPRYIAVKWTFYGYPHVEDGEAYLVPGFDAAASIETQMRINAAISCIKRNTGGNFRILFSASSFPQLPSGAPKPMPVRSETEPKKHGFWHSLFGGDAPPVASPINDSQAFFE